MRLVQSEWLILSPERFEVLGSTRAIVAVAGDDIILPCYIKPNISAEDMRVDWFRINLPDPQSNIRVHLYQDGIDKYHDQVLSYRGRTSLFKEELKKGNTSLKLTRVQGTDDGRYKCLVESKTHYDDATIQVYVRGTFLKYNNPYDVPPNLSSTSSPVSLCVCSYRIQARGFH